MKLNASHRAIIIEMGMSAAGEIDTLARLVIPTVGMITNIGPAHLEFFGSLDKVAEAKAELLDNLTSNATAVLNADDPFFGSLKKKCRGRIVTFGITNKADVRASQIRQERDSAISAFADGARRMFGSAVERTTSTTLCSAAAATAMASRRTPWKTA
jgi:UDP-N-acetylmuramoyl-tripeptide--D-alanyl-D-alanine ligase